MSAVIDIPCDEKGGLDDVLTLMLEPYQQLAMPVMIRRKYPYVATLDGRERCQRQARRLDRCQPTSPSSTSNTIHVTKMMADTTVMIARCGLR